MAAGGRSTDAALANVTDLSEEFQLDPLGNVPMRRSSDGADQQHREMPRYQNYHAPNTGRLLWARKLPPSVPDNTWTPDETTRHYDASGNVSRGYQQVGGIGTSGDAVIAREVESRSFYGADDRLRMFQTYEVRRTDWSNYVNAGVWEEYRYDALGRRVMVRTRTDAGLCDVDPWTCTASVTRFVWAGDNVLWELKQAEGSMAPAAGGSVSYFHAGGIDRPLVITKDGQSIIPHQNWRGQFARGTYPNGYRSDCTQGATTGCTPIQWPGERTSARHELEKDGSIQNWYGGLVDGMRDASGQMYMRNRYYDPATGQFTQTDPIGLAGGLNAYGFAAGDPVSYSDPYGLSCEPKPACERSQNAFALGGGGGMRPGLFAGAASMLVKPVAEPLSEHGAMRAQLTVVNTTYACAAGAAQGCSTSAEVGAPAFGASISAGWLNSSAPTVWANVGASKHTSMSVSPQGVWLNIGPSIGGSPVSGTVDVPSLGGKAISSQGGGPVEPDATSVNNVRSSRTPARRACAPSGGCATPN